MGVVWGQMSESNAPFTTLGKHLKYIREQQDESLAEVSGAVEIDAMRLERIEAGRERPSEDILLLLISHFDMNEQQAVQLWELADYGDEMPDQIKPDVEQMLNKQVVMLLATDTRTLYSDGVEAAVNKAGVTLNFTQANGQNSNSTVSKIGMSLEQAQEVIRQIQSAMLKAKYASHPKLLPPETKK